MQTAAVVSQGASQAVQLPLGFRFESTEVYVKRVGRSILLIPKDVDPWDFLADSLHQFTGDFMEDRAQPPQQQREAPFE